MSAVKTIDPRGLEHHEREALIFPSIENLPQGETLRIIMEFNPVPLVYLLETSNEFEISCEQNGPGEWHLEARRIAAGGNKKGPFKQIREELKEGEISEVAKQKAKKIFTDLDAKSLAMTEQELIKEGLSPEQVRTHLCDIHLEALKDKLVEKRLTVEAPHPVHSFMEEHKIILENLKELSALAAGLPQAESLKAWGENLDRLKDVAHHLVEAESHHQREEEALFPELEKHDIAEPGNIMKMDHVEFRQRKQALYQIAHSAEDYEFDEFRKRVVELAEYLARELEGHIFKEDNIIYQIALQTLTSQEWQEVKKECDKIGYCCFTPQNRG
jgi:hypothetical protein